MDVTNFIGDFESIEELLQHPDTKPGDSAYISTEDTSTSLSALKPAWIGSV